MQYWLMKSEPSSYSIDDLAAKKGKRDGWEGIRNYQVRNMLRDEMKVGDKAFFYHSSCKPAGIVGIVEIVKEAYPDLSALNKTSKYYDAKSNPNNIRWVMVDVRLDTKFKRMITLDELKQNKALQGLVLLRKGNRLSVSPVSKKHWDIILRLV